MSMHKIIPSNHERKGLELYKLPVGTPSQPSDFFRCGYDWANRWTSIKESMPACDIESEEDHDDNGYPRFHGMVSKSLEITDGQQYARGHYRDNGTWAIYGAEHDFQIVDPKDITHFKALPELP
jgi:hypothetical protein